MDPSRHLANDGHATRATTRTGIWSPPFVECARGAARRLAITRPLSPRRPLHLQLSICLLPLPDKTPLSRRASHPCKQGRKPGQHDTGVPVPRKISRLPPRRPAAAEQRFAPSPALLLRPTPSSDRRPSRPFLSLSSSIVAVG